MRAVKNLMDNFQIEVWKAREGQSSLNDQRMKVSLNHRCHQFPLSNDVTF